MAAIAKGPVSVALDAGTPMFQHYKSGVLDDPKCGRSLNHAVLAVGYGADYFIVKNSWTATWGDKGYIKISNSKADICGILDGPVFPTE